MIQPQHTQSTESTITRRSEPSDLATFAAAQPFSDEPICEIGAVATQFWSTGPEDWDAWMQCHRLSKIRRSDVRTFTRYELARLVGTSKFVRFVVAGRIAEWVHVRDLGHRWTRDELADALWSKHCAALEAAARGAVKA